MHDYTKRLPGQVTVMERPSWTYEGVFARFSKFGIEVPRLKPDSDQLVLDGPHFYFECLSTNFFINSICRVQKAHLEYNFSADYLGHIDSHFGYGADTETDSFPIKLLTLRADFCPGETQFKISGKCGDRLPRKHSMRITNCPQQFVITFSVSDASLANFFDQEGEVDAFKRNRKSCVPDF